MLYHLELRAGIVSTRSLLPLAA